MSESVEHGLELVGSPVTIAELTLWAKLAGKAYVDAVYSDSYSELGGFFAEPIARRIQMVDELGAAHGRDAQDRFYTAVCDPIAVVDGHVRVRMTLWMVAAAGEPYVWSREIWSVRIPAMKIEHGACDVCGGPYGASRFVCRFCATRRADDGSGFLVVSSASG